MEGRRTSYSVPLYMKVKVWLGVWLGWMHTLLYYTILRCSQWGPISGCSAAHFEEAMSIILVSNSLS